MKMKKLLAAALAVLMLLTMLPVGVFAADVDYKIEFSEDGYPIVNGTVLTEEPDEGEYGYKAAWCFDRGILDLMEGTFVVNSDIPLVGVYLSDDVTLVDCNFSAHVGNAGTIIGGTIDGSVDNRGTISGGTFEDYVENGEGALISGGTFNDYVNNYGTISGGTFNGEVLTIPTSPQDLYYAENKEKYKGWGNVYNVEGDSYSSTSLYKIVFQNEDAPKPNPEDITIELSGFINWTAMSLDQEMMRDAGWEVIGEAEYTGEEWYYLYEDTRDLPRALSESDEVWPTYDIYYVTLPENYEVVSTSYEILTAEQLTESDNEQGIVNVITVAYKAPAAPTPPVYEEEEEDDGFKVSVRVKFDGVDEDEIDFVNAQLVKDGENYKKAVKVDERDDWYHKWTNLDDDDDIEWTVTAEEIEGYNMVIENVRGNYWTITLSKAAAEKTNPSTGADSYVGAAVAMAVCSVMCAAALSMKK